MAKVLYEGPIMDTLRKHCGNKRSHTVIEDNDPTGYKSNTAKAAKS